MAAVTTNSVVLTLGYKDTDYTRRYVFDGMATADLEDVKSKVLAYNQNLPEADKLIFISEDFDDSDPQAVVGTLKGIVAAQYSVSTTTQIPLN